MTGDDSSNSDAPSTAAVECCPKRFHWAKRIAAAYLLLVVALLVTRWVWGYLADRRVAAELAVITARGETVDWLALEPASIPDAENAAVCYERACMAMSMTDDQREKIYKMLDSPSFLTKCRADADAILMANAAIFAECRSARAASGVNWRVEHVSPSMLTTLPMFGDQRRLAHLLCLKALRQAEGGDSAGAIETLRDVEALGRAVGKDMRLISHLVSMSIHSIGVTAIERIAPQLEVVSKSGVTAPGAGPAAPQAARALIDDLLDGHLLASSREAMVFERALVNHVAETALYTPGGLAEIEDAWPGWESIAQGPVVTHWVFRPILRCDQARMLRRCNHYVEAASQTSLPSARARCPEASSGFFLENASFRFTRAMTCIWGDFGARPLWLTYLRITRRRLAATALALRLYEIEHGKPAKSLAELVGEYLHAVPTDPMDPAGKPIRALLTAPKPRLYSLGDNMTDDGGVFSPEQWDTTDIVFFLRTGDRPEPSDQ